MSPDSHLEPKLLNARISALEKREMVREAKCRECYDRTHKLVRELAADWVAFKHDVGSMITKMDKSLAKMCKPIKDPL